MVVEMSTSSVHAGASLPRKVRKNVGGFRTIFHNNFGREQIFCPECKLAVYIAVIVLNALQQVFQVTVLVSMLLNGGIF